MLVPMTLVLTVTAVVACHGHEPKTGTVLTKGWLDKALMPVGKTYKIPTNLCSQISINKDEYDCRYPLRLVTLRVTARSVSLPPIEITDDFGAVQVYGCGPVYVHLERACVHWLHHPEDSAAASPSHHRAARALPPVAS